jgi:hypothetical protein
LNLHKFEQQNKRKKLNGAGKGGGGGTINLLTKVHYIISAHMNKRIKFETTRFKIERCITQSAFMSYRKIIIKIADLKSLGGI